ncbi:auxin-responsive protein SAUR36 [Cynara cardunculus var. scolymus]|uniref:Auxin responsive SAUR protein n=1 Tax=Cynara cardunculus var. scolymus TaxID=59895 RepID=A0A124SDI8_CYNCS|nr:auxin-responsive protein SAUR36 [Cynara cardunculus var. scolymus]KVH97102.1 Auxin responsive SAUR protein [Cynara cardunculus var. scolymus]
MKIRGFLIKHRVSSLFRRVCRRNLSPSAGYRRLDQSPRSMSKLLKWGVRLKTKAMAICSKNSGFQQKNLVLGKGLAQPRAAVPKGKMAVYVGQKDGDFKRVLVPVIYINHPLFGQLLREAEEEYGHNHSGGITIPCRISEFENVKTRIAAVCGCRKLLTRWRRTI